MRIAIAGAGPAGLATALLLAQQGKQVTLIEQEPNFERVFRGEGLMPAGLAALREMGLAATFEAIAHRQLTSWDFYVGGQRRMRVVEPCTDGLATQIINQGALLEGMLREAKQYENFEFLPGYQAVELLNEDSQRVSGLRVSHDSGDRTISADVVIAGDGRYSRLRKLADLALEESLSQFDVLWFKLPAPDSLADETPFIACLQPDRQFAFYPSWDGRLQVGWIVEKRKHKKGGLAALKEQDWIEAFAPALPPILAKHFRQQKENLEGPIYLDVRVGCCEQWSVPGLLLIGDAAHPMAPNRAQGINMALRDAIIVANHFRELAHSAETQHSAIDSALQAIQAERQPEIEAVQKMQLAEWRKVEVLSQPGLPYQGFKAIATLFGRFRFAQNIWLHEQKGLREGTRPVHLRQ